MSLFRCPALVGHIWGTTGDHILGLFDDPQGGTFQTKGGVNGRHYAVGLEF